MEMDVPSTRRGLFVGSIVLMVALAPALVYWLVTGLATGDNTTAMLSGYGIAMLFFAAFVLARQMGSPDRVKVDDSGFVYSFQNITFRVGWDDVAAVDFANSREVRVRLHDTSKVASSSLISSRRPLGRTQFNPYTSYILKRTGFFRNPWPKTPVALAEMLDETAASRGYHIAIPVFASSEQAEQLYETMRARHAAWRPGYKPLGFTTAAPLTEPRAPASEARTRRPRKRQ